MSTALRDASTIARVVASERHAILRALERKVLWLASWTIHNANHLRPDADGLKVGGHQASCASLTTLMTALYFDVLRPEDRVAVKPHASPVFHAIQYLLGHQSRAHLERFRAMGGAQSYPSRTKDADDVDFSTGSVGLGVAMTTFASLVQDYVQARDWDHDAGHRGRMVALVGDAELDEGNVFEALLEGWKHDVRNLWWVVDYNRQSLDAVVSDRLFGRFDRLFSNMGWRVETLKYGKRLQAAFERPGGERLKDWIDDCPNSLYSALVFKGGGAWREHLLADIGASAGVKALLDEYDDAALAALMTNLAGHDMESVLEAFHGVDTDQPTCFIAYTIKGFGLPFAGHKDNHAGLMSVPQMEALKHAHRVSEGAEWERFAGLDLDPEVLDAFLADVPFAAGAARRHRAPRIAVPATFAPPAGKSLSTQESFGRILASLARDGGEFADRIVSASPDVTVSTNLGGWVNRRGIFSRKVQEDTFNVEQVASFQRWAASPKGQHIELGIAENNLFILLAALGLSHSLFGTRLLPIGTLYDPFIQRGLDALNYACYQDARFLLVATPSGITLAPEGGAHQSISTPMIGMAQDGLASFEPAFADELAVIMRWAFEYMQRDDESPAAADDDWLADTAGGSVYLRLSTRSVAQPARDMDAKLGADIVDGGYWLEPPVPGARLAIVYTGAVASEAMAAHAQLLEDLPGAGLLAVTSADRLAKGWHAATGARRRRMHDGRCHVEKLLAPLAPDAHLITVVDGHPATLGWLGSVRGQRVRTLGVERFGQSGSMGDLYRHHGIDTDAILDACAAACLEP
jgi:pyruvate dehydrogenase E1 component